MALRLSDESFISGSNQLHRFSRPISHSNDCHLATTRGALKSVLCFCTGTRTKKERASKSDEPQEILRDDQNTKPSRGLSEACRFFQNDAKFVNERARNDFTLLSRGIMNLDARARRDVALLSSGFQILDEDMKAKAERLQRMAAVLRDRAQYRLRVAADKHWSDGALKDDLWLADNRARQRAMEDALMALEFVKNIHDLMVTKMYELEMLDRETIKLEKNGRAMESFPGKISRDRITAIQEAYWSMASALSEADGIDYTDPEELELLIATLIDLDAMDGKSSVSLLAECSRSPDVNTRKALAKALASAPSMWTLGNAGMGALQRLAEDSNPAIAAAATNAINELRKQWEMEEGDSWRFTIQSNGEGDSNNEGK